MWMYSYSLENIKVSFLLEEGSGPQIMKNRNCDCWDLALWNRKKQAEDQPSLGKYECAAFYFQRANKDFGHKNMI